MDWKKQDYILKETLKKLNNYQLLVLATERFTQLMYFLKDYRSYKNHKIKIGNFEYDDFEADIYCILDEKDGVYFEHIRNYDKKSWKHKTLTEQLIYAWGFEETEFNINFDLINQFWHLLDNKSKEDYDWIYDDIHALFW